MAGYSGDGSWKKIINSIFLIKGDAEYKVMYQEYNKNIQPDEITVVNNLSLTHAGYIHNGNINFRNLVGHYWNNKVANNENAYYLGFYISYLKVDTLYRKGRGYSVRWGAK